MVGPNDHSVFGYFLRMYLNRRMVPYAFSPDMMISPVHVSRESVSTSMSLNNSSAKAQRELGWTYRPAKEMWLDIIDQEPKLLTNRKKRDLVSRLKPLETTE